MDDITRRTWFFQLSSGAIVAGFSGIDLRAAAGSTDLPPGLYRPSLNHLTHILKMRPAAGGPFQPLFFTADDFSKITHLTALILGEATAAPSVSEVAQWIDLLAYESALIRKSTLELEPEHRDLAVARYGEDAVRKLETDETQELCLKGLAGLHQDGFFTADESVQIRMLEAREDSHDPFIAWLKRNVINGFYTSKEGLKELDYKGNSFYAECPGCEHGHHAPASD